MAQPTPHANSLTRTVVALVAVCALLHLAGTNDLVSNITRPLVVGLLNLLGSSAQDAGGELILGRMHVPWTRDCAGVNILTMLWVVTLWANRAEPFSGRYWLRLAFAVPAALGANICRILTLLGYRYLLFPAVETPQLHYFIGFLWVIPCLPLFVPRAGRDFGRYLLETIFLVAALSLLSPFVFAPGGSLVTIATLLLVAESRYCPLQAGRRYAGMAWVLAAVCIAAASMESLWLPWLLLSPWFGQRDLRRAPGRLLLVLGTIPLVAMHPVARWFVVAAAGLEVWTLRKGPSKGAEPDGQRSPAVSFLGLCARGGLVGLLVLPFLSSSLTGMFRSGLRPPAGAMWRVLSVNTYQVRLVGQPGDVELLWYGPSGDGRHHTLPVCMRYRGTELKPSRVESSVMTDGKLWMREFFLQRGALLTDYPAYLRHTLLPWSSAGVHIIASAPVDSLSAKAFADSTMELAVQLNQLDAAALPQMPSEPQR